MRDALKAHGPAQLLIFLQELAQFAVAEGARGDGDGGQQEEGAGGEVAPLAPLGRLGRRLLVVFCEALK